MPNLKFNTEYDKSVPREFEVTLYGQVERYSDSMSKCRVRIFYKGLNRNRTFISEDFANQLIASLPYTPVKGIFDTDEMDYTDHGEKNRDGKIYGIVMAEPNFAWEPHIDVDGVERMYACADVLLFTALYPEAKIVPGSSQSMEINPYTYTGEWKIWEDGMPYYEFKTGSLFGLQILGMVTEPCFEGAAFYSLMKDELQPLIDYMKQISKKEGIKMEIEKTTSEPVIENEAQEVETPVAEEVPAAEPAVDSAVEETAEAAETEETPAEEPVIENEAKEEVVEETPAEETPVEETPVEETPVEEPTTESAVEETPAETPDTTNGVATPAPAEDPAIEEYKAQIQQLQASLAEKITAYDALSAEKIRIENEKVDLISERNELLEFKKNVETEKKMSILEKYSEHLTDESIDTFKANLANYSVEDFKKEVCTAAVENNPSIFSKHDEPEHLYAKNIDDSDKALSGMERILDQYKKNGGNK